MNRRTTTGRAAALFPLFIASLVVACLNPRPEEVPQSLPEAGELPGFGNDPNAHPLVPGGGTATPPASNEGASPVQGEGSPEADRGADVDAGAPDAGLEPPPADNEAEADTTEDGE